MAAMYGDVDQLAWVVIKAALLFVVAVVGIRMGERRTLGQLNVVDYVVAVAVGAIIGRSATSSTTSFATGAVALLTLLVVHRLVVEARFRGWLAGVLHRRPLVLVKHGRIREDALAAGRLTRADLYALVRAAGISTFAGVAYLLYETTGAVSIV